VALRHGKFAGTTGTLVNSPAIPDPAGATADRLLAYTVFDGMSLLAVQSIGDSHVSIYDATDPSAPVYLGAGNNTTGVLTANANASGQLAWGAGSGDTIKLYAMSTNQGIQAFTIQVPEPASVAMLAGLAGIFSLRRRRAD